MSVDEPAYSSLPALREALRSDDSTTVENAYEAVYDAGFKPKDVQGSDPPREQLAAAGLIPFQNEEKGIQQQILDELQGIRAELGGEN